MKPYISTEDLYKLFIQCNQKISTDTRKLENGSLFFALKGDNFDANEFSESAIQGGCSFAIVDDEKRHDNSSIFLVENVLESLQQLAKYHRQQLKFPIIGITGSNGKTTNKELIHAVLSKKYNAFATKGNLNNHIGVPLTLLSLTHDHEIAIVEMGANHQGEIAMLCELSNPDYGLITNIGKAHLEGFGGIEGVKIGKSELYKHISSSKGKIFINGDDDVLLELSNNLEKIYYGASEEFNVHGKSYSNSEFVEFKWNVNNQSVDNQLLVKTHMFGQYNFINLLCAVCIGNYFAVSKNEINDALANYIPEMNRSQIKKTANNLVILDAYNANPSSMNLAIDNFNNQAFENKTAIIGDMLELGDYTYQEHEKVVLQLTKSKIKNVLFVGAHFFEFKKLFRNYLFFINANELKDYLVSHQIVDSTLLIKGSRGMQLEKIIEYL
jgi:UDP-N-acetylmuramoyl-tripeptide--D-alanyl-D-alanine ligase